MSSTFDTDVEEDDSDLEEPERSEKVKYILGRFVERKLQVKPEPSIAGSLYCPWCPGKKPHNSVAKLIGHAAAMSRYAGQVSRYGRLH